jgi:hypothetical protein
MNRIAKRRVWNRIGSAAAGLRGNLILAACAGSLQEPPTTPHANDAFQEVPYLPPAALVEVTGTAPEESCVWFDGHWVWRGDNYVWKRGGWVTSSEHRYYAPWKSVVLPDGRLLFAEGAWYDRDGRRVAEPEIVKPARTPPNEMTSEFDSPR